MEHVAFFFFFNYKGFPVKLQDKWQYKVLNAVFHLCINSNTFVYELLYSPNIYR